MNTSWLDPELRTHKEWLGFLQPVGLVVSPPALLDAQAIVNRSVVPLQQKLETLTRTQTVGGSASPRCVLTDFPTFTREVLGWEKSDLVGLGCETALPPTLELALPKEVLRPTWAVPAPHHAGTFLMVIQQLPVGTPMDDTGDAKEEAGYHASPQQRIERLMHGIDIHIGLLFNGVSLRLVYAPPKETSGHLTFPIQAMLEVPGRLILGALHMLLDAERLFSLPADRCLPALLAKSREYQNTVSTALADQVFEGLGELLRGFQTADRLSRGCIFGDTMANEPQHIYGGLLTAMMRLLFLLYAEDKGLVPQTEVYNRNYGLAGLFERLREDAGRYPDTMDQRYGAWAWLLTLFRLVHAGGKHGDFHLPKREGELFSPDMYPFLEGRPRMDQGHIGTFEPPRVSDGVIHRVLERLLMLHGERLSYRSLDVEHLGSVYEAMMGYTLERMGGHGIAVTPHHVMVNLDELLELPAAERAEYLEKQADCKVDGKGLDALKKACTVADVVAALGRKVSSRTQNLLPPDTLYLQPGEDRRRSGSHYTPRKLTEPIVKTALRPVLEALGPSPTPDQLLELKVCDPAMGSGAFLVEACRQLGDALVQAIETHGLPHGQEIPLDESPLIYAKRRVAECCLYGVDKNPFAVSLAKLSLWLETLAKDRAFTFVDHALMNGDSLVGLSRDQLRYFHWRQENKENMPLLEDIPRQTNAAATLRSSIQSLGEGQDGLKRERLKVALDNTAHAKLAGDLVIAAFFSADKDKARDDQRKRLRLKLDRVELDRLKLDRVEMGQGSLHELTEIAHSLRDGPRPLPPFHWELEFPEVFERENPGFDCVVGNPPFAGKNTITNGTRSGYLEWLKVLHEGSHGNADLVAHFFRRAFIILRQGGALGLIATNTIAQGDTRSTGLRWICEHGGALYSAKRRVKWPGLAAVVVSVVHVQKGQAKLKPLLNAREVERISAFLFHAGGDTDPAPLAANESKAFIGSYVLGMGFTFDDTNPEATSIAEMNRLITKDPRNAERIFPYIGGEEVNSSPTHQHHRYVINFGDMSEDDARRWPDLLSILERKIIGTRGNHSTAPWWQFERVRGELYEAIAPLSQIIVISRISPQSTFTFVHPRQVFSEALVVFALSTANALSLLQSRVHEIWARFFGSTLEDRLRYTPSDCFETFPFPPNWEQNERLEQVGQTYYAFRAKVMVDNNEGLTSTYNRFHDPDEHDERILELRRLHAELDRAVLDAYGWPEISHACGFALDYLELEDAVTLPPDVSARVEGGELFFPDALSAADFDAAIRSASKKKRKLPWRLKWPEAVHDDVLARLLELNQVRAQEEAADKDVALREAKGLAKPRGKATAEVNDGRAGKADALKREKARKRGPFEDEGQPQLTFQMQANRTPK